MSRASEIDRLIESISLSKEFLQAESFQSVCNFISHSQTPTGAFANRSGDPDWYYSFFAYLMCEAFGMHNELKKLRLFVLHSKPGGHKELVDQIVWALLHHSFKPGFIFKFCFTIQLPFCLIDERKKTDKVYLLFLSLMVMDHFWQWPRYASKLAGRITARFNPDEHAPTSHLAAILHIDTLSGRSNERVVNALLKRAHRDGGFGLFGSPSSVDLLSTAVATYALSRASIQLNHLASDGLNYLSSLYLDGAFLPDDGDNTPDCEYTFYGLLAIGCYGQQLKLSPSTGKG